MKTKECFKIILVLQLIACALANYGHPDAEVFNLPNQPSRDQLIIQAAISRGMDGEAVAELLRTKIPVVRNTTTDDGYTKTTTYELRPDGSISSKTTLSKRNRYVYNSDSIPDELKNAPTGTITRTFTDSNGNKVTQTVAVNQGGKSSTVKDTDDLSDDWFSKSFPSWQDETPSSSAAFNTKHSTITRTYTDPKGERRTTQFWSSNSELPQPVSTVSRTYTTTHSNSGGEDTTQPKFSPINDFNWPNFDLPSFNQPWHNRNLDDLDGWEVLHEPEKTTKKQFDAGKSWEWPNFPTYPTSPTTTAKPLLLRDIEHTTPKNLPNLDEFLKSQYGSRTNNAPMVNADRTTSTYRPKSVILSTTPKTYSSTHKIIKIEDLPVVEVLHNGKPASESILKQLPAHLTPRTPTEHVLSIENKHPIENDFEEEDIEDYKLKTNIRTLSKTHIGVDKPRLKDLDPQMQDILRNAGIVPEIEGDNVTKTRKEPDGRIITTTYKVNTVPMEHTSTGSNYVPYLYSSHKPYAPLAALTPPPSPIVQFLAKLGLTKFDIKAQNGHYSKTIIDENGDVLTATFVLSSPQLERFNDNHRVKPNK